jgi:small-conductance mechanosensitive channel
MPITREFMFLAATALAWLAYALAVAEAGSAPSLGVEVARAAALVLTAMVAVRVVGIAVTDLLLEHAWEITATSLIRLTVYLVLGGLAVTLVLRFAFEVNLATLLTTSALLTAIIGLALQPTLAALLAGLAIQIEHRLRPGDVIRVDNRLASVEAMGWRSIAARRLDGSLVMVPNAMLAAQQIAILRPGAPLMFEMLVPGPLSIPPAIVEEIITEAVADIPGISEDHPVVARLAQLKPGEDTVDFRLRFFARGVFLDEDPFGALVRTRLWYAYQRHRLADICPQPAPPPEETEESRPPTPLLRADHSYADHQRVVSALAASRRWHSVARAEQLDLAKTGERLLYAPQEAIRLPRGISRAVALVIAGEIVLNGDPDPAAVDIEPPLSETPDIAAAVHWNPELLLDVEQRLAEAIGPYARYAVSSTARDTTDSAALHQRLAVLVRNPAAHDAFLQAAPRQPAGRYGRGTVLQLRRSSRGRNNLLTAHGQVELLVLPPGAPAEAAPDAADAVC